MRSKLQFHTNVVLTGKYFCDRIITLSINNKERKKRMLKQLARSIREYKRPTILTLLFMVGEAVIETAIPFITATYLINVIQRDGSNVDMGYILKIGLILALGAVFSLSFAGLAGFTCAKASAGFAKNLRRDLFGKIQTFSFTYFPKVTRGSTTEYIISDSKVPIIVNIARNILYPITNGMSPSLNA